LCHNFKSILPYGQRINSAAESAMPSTRLKITDSENGNQTGKVTSPDDVPRLAKYQRNNTSVNRRSTVRPIRPLTADPPEIN